MSALDLLTQRLLTAARKPPEMAKQKIASYATKTIASSLTTSTGARRAVVRQSLAQQRAALDASKGAAIQSATEDVLTQAKAVLSP